MLQRIGGSYAPRDNDQPLRWMLRFAGNAYKHRSKSLLEWFDDFFNDSDVKFTDALKKFTIGCKEGDGFEVLVRHPYLELA
jgi:hypothetical protein